MLRKEYTDQGSKSNQNVTPITFFPNDPHALTILTQAALFDRSPTLQSKRYSAISDDPHALKIEPYGDAFTYAPTLDKADTINALYRLLCALEDKQDACIIRGALKPEFTDREQVHRTKKPHGNRPAFFEEVDRSWLCIDLDNTRLPQPIDPTDREQVEASILWAASLIPEMDGVSFVAQLSSSAFLDTYKHRYTDKDGKEQEETRVRLDGGKVKLDGRKLKLHLWILLDSPACEKALGDWTKRHPAKLDPATSRTVQPHYTAKPDFVGVNDPLPQRTFLFLRALPTMPSERCRFYDRAEAARRAEVEASERNERNERNAKARAEAKQIAQNRGIVDWMDDCTDRTKGAMRLVDKALEEIRFASVGNRHATIYGQAFWIGRLVGGDNGLDEGQTIALLKEAATTALAGDGRAEEAERTAKDGFEEGKKTPLTLEPWSKTTKKARKQRRQEAKEKKQVDSLLSRYARLSEQSRQSRLSERERSERDELRRWLAPILKQNGLDAILASLGTGKTEQAKALCAQYGRVLWLAHRRALTRNTSERLGDSFVLYLDHDGELVCERLILCVDSIARAVDTVDLVVVDEADQVLQSLIKRPRKGKHADAILHRIEYLSAHLKEARQIVLLSADLDGWTVEAFAKMAGIEADKVRHVKHEYSHPSASWRFFEKGTAWKLAVRKAWISGERLGIFCASREQVKVLAEWMQELRPTAKIISVHAEAEDADRESLLCVGDTWGRADAVLFTTSAGSGVSFDAPDHFDRVCVWGTNAPKGFMASEYTQGSERIRNPKIREVWAYICDGGRDPLTREQIRRMERDREKSTLQHIQKTAPLGVVNGKIERSKADTLAVFVWLHALASREERAAHPLRWLLKTLLARSIRIIHDQGEPTQKEAKALGSELSEAKTAQREKEIEAVLSAEDLSIEQADKLRRIEASKAEQDALKKHDTARFYLDTRDESTACGIVQSTPPPQPSADLIMADKRGRTRKQIGALLDALFWRVCPEYFAALDRMDLVVDPEQKFECDTTATAPRKVRSVVDAAHHALRAELASDMLDVVCAHHTDLHAYFFGGCPHTEDPTPPPDIATALTKLFSRGPERLAMMRVRGLSPASTTDKIVGDLCQYLGIKRTSEQVRQGEGRARLYSIDYHALDRLSKLATVERGKRERRIARWQEQESLAAQGGNTVTVKISREEKHSILFECDTPSTVQPPPPSSLPPCPTFPPSTSTSTSIPSHQKSILRAFAGEALAWVGLGDDAPFEAKASALLAREGAEDVARLARQARDAKQDTTAIIGRMVSIMDTVAGYLGVPTETLTPYANKLLVA